MITYAMLREAVRETPPVRRNAAGRGTLLVRGTSDFAMNCGSGRFLLMPWGQLPYRYSSAGANMSEYQVAGDHVTYIAEPTHGCAFYHPVRGIRSGRQTPVTGRVYLHVPDSNVMVLINRPVGAAASNGQYYRGFCCFINNEELLERGGSPWAPAAVDVGSVLITNRA